MNYDIIQIIRNNLPFMQNWYKKLSYTVKTTHRKKKNVYKLWYITCGWHTFYFHHKERQWSKIKDRRQYCPYSANQSSSIFLSKVPRPSLVNRSNSGLVLTRACLTWLKQITLGGTRTDADVPSFSSSSQAWLYDDLSKSSISESTACMYEKYKKL